MQKQCLYFIGILCVLTLMSCSSTERVIQVDQLMKVKPSQVNQRFYKEIQATDVSYDAKTGELRYTLPEAALVRIRFGLLGASVLLRTFADWEKREAGEHIEVWDFKDASGEINFKSYKNVYANLSCLSLSSVTDEEISNSSLFKGSRKSPKFEVSFPDVKKKEKGIPVLSGVSLLRITIDEADQRWLSDSKFELGIFVDTVFITEDEQGNNPYNYSLNTKGMYNGEHFITVNIIGYHGEIGTKSVRIYVQN